MAKLNRVSTFAIVACNIAHNVAGVEASSGPDTRCNIASNIARNRRIVSTFAIVACSVAEIEASSTSATFHAMVWRNKKLLANQISLFA